jgi:glycosyltransferase involved in cell wall biosynthesis
LNILITAWTYPQVSQSFVHEPAGWLRDRGHGVSVISDRRGELMPGDRLAVPGRVLGPWMRRGEKLRLIAGNPALALRRLPFAARWRDHRSQAEILARSLLPEVRASDCVLAHFGTVAKAWLPVAGLARTPMAAFFHGFDATRALREDPRRYDGLFRSGVPLLVNSRYLAGRLRDAGAPADRIFVVPLAGSQDFSVATANPEPERIICTIGRLVEKKGFEDSIEAFAMAQDVLRGQWKYEIIGDGDLRGRLSTLVNDLGLQDLVTFRGSASRQEVREALSRAGIFLLLSRTAKDGDTEGTPIAIMEAGLSWVPVVSTNHAGIPEVLPGDAGDLGFLVEEGDVEGAAEALRSLASDGETRAMWGRRCRTHVAERYAQHRYMDRLLQVLNREASIPLPQ